MTNITPYDRIITEICAAEQIKLSTLSDGWIKILEKSDSGNPTSIRRYIIGFNFELNSHTAAMLADDKTATSDILARAKLPVVRHEIFYSPDLKEGFALGRNSLNIIKDYFYAHEKSIVLKPNGGTMGKCVFHITDETEILPSIQQIFSFDYWHHAGASGAMCPFYQIEHEYRVIMLDGEASLIYQKNLTPKSGDKFNLSQGASAVKLSKDSPLRRPLVQLATAAVKTLHLRFASVDIIKTTEESDLRILEVNSGVSVNGYITEHPEDYNLVKGFLQKAIEKMFQSS